MNRGTQHVSIPLEEYKELLIIKGRYEELKNKTNITWTPPPKTTITYTGPDGKKVSMPTTPYKVTC
jgi:hypothetical protein